jgi:hypothetical protein
MAEAKTKKTTGSVTQFINAIEDRQKRADCRAVSKMMGAATGCRARMWGSSIVGFGTYNYAYANGKSGTSMLCGFSPRKQELSIYIMPGFKPFTELMGNLGKHRVGKSCLYIKRLADIDQDKLESLINQSVRLMKKKYQVK